MTNQLNHSQFLINSFFTKKKNKSFLDVLMQKEQRLRVDNYQEIISNTFTKINNLMPILDTIIQRRLNEHQIEMLKIVKNQIQKMQNDLNAVISQYNQMIRTKNRDQTILSMNNDIQLYKAQNIKLHNSNHQLNKQIQRLKNIIKQYQIDIENGGQTLKSVTRKYLKLKLKNRQETKGITTEVNSNYRTKTCHDEYQTTDNWLGKQRRIKVSSQMKKYPQILNNRSFKQKILRTPSYKNERFFVEKG